MLSNAPFGIKTRQEEEEKKLTSRDAFGYARHLKTFTKETKINNGFSKSCSSNSIFLSENCFRKDLVDKRPRKLTLNSENALFLMSRLYLLVQYTQISSEYVDLHAKRMLILDTRI